MTASGEALPHPTDPTRAQAVLEAAAREARQALAHGNKGSAMRIVLGAIRRLRSDRPETLDPPPAIGEARWDALLAAGARMALRGRPQLPEWTNVRLERPWFPSEGTGIMPDDYRAITIRRTPSELARANIFLGWDPSAPNARL
jgi:hypothetical protein